jgi:hypothetical protein
MLYIVLIKQELDMRDTNRRKVEYKRAASNRQAWREYYWQAT